MRLCFGAKLFHLPATRCRHREFCIFWQRASSSKKTRNCDYETVFFILQNSTLSSYPYLTLWVISLFASPVADFLISRKYLTIGATRNVFNTIGFFVPAAALAAIGFLEPEQKTWAVVMLMISVGVSSFTYSSYMVNHIDLSPKYAGSLMGITNGPGMFFSIVAPLAISGIESFGYAEVCTFILSKDKILINFLFHRRTASSGSSYSAHLPVFY